MKFRFIVDKNREEEIVITAHERTELVDRIEHLVMQYSGSDRIAVYLNDDLLMLPIHKIECITIIDGKTIAIDRTGTRYRLRQRLYEVEERLPASFIRINKSTLANENHLERFAVTITGSVDAVFKCGYREYVSRRCFSAIKRRYEGK